ncbi:hypothetical protein Dsin_013538 [Dipteronia sinensis]|uniref:CCHC-type domain-containing protein n=1 Tax=Dipteronia sinensis TaxID=43782 RepID=A0AAE0AK58_9ROSI|nr:hypothetical protein Dsin_013538 [Dipteronia sinensis]
MSNKLVNRNAFINMIPKIWRTKNSVEIEVIDENMFSFTFKNEQDRFNVLQGGPWSFDKALLVLSEPKGKGDVKGMSFKEVAFWVQIHNVPLLCVTKEIGIFLGSMVGKVREIDTGPSGECVGKYIRVRVVINVDQPLRRILRVDVMRDGKESTMLLRYERLLEHCYMCGRIGHVVLDCLERMENDDPEDYNLMYGAWLKASSPIKMNQYRKKKEGVKDAGVKEVDAKIMSVSGVSRNDLSPPYGDNREKGKAVVGNLTVETVSQVVGLVTESEMMSQNNRGEIKKTREGKCGGAGP